MSDKPKPLAPPNKKLPNYTPDSPKVRVAQINREFNNLNRSLRDLNNINEGLLRNNQEIREITRPVGAEEYLRRAKKRRSITSRIIHKLKRRLKRRIGRRR